MSLKHASPCARARACYVNIIDKRKSRARDARARARISYYIRYIRISVASFTNFHRSVHRGPGVFSLHAIYGNKRRRGGLEKEFNINPSHGE